MNTELTNISNKIQVCITDKSRPDADPMKVLAEDLGEILQDFVNYLNANPPSVQPISGLTATPQSDTEILLTWTNPV